MGFVSFCHLLFDKGEMGRRCPTRRQVEMRPGQFENPCSDGLQSPYSNSMIGLAPENQNEMSDAISPENTPPKSTRLLSLDAYRGLIMVTLAFNGFGIANSAA